VGLLSRVMARIDKLACVRPDLAANDERLLTSVVQFDALAMLIVLAYAPGDRDYPYHPSFARYYWSRFDPALARVITEPETRAKLHPGSDQELADDIRRMLTMAAEQGKGFAGGGPLTHATVRSFLETNPGDRGR